MVARLRQDFIGVAAATLGVEQARFVSLEAEAIVHLDRDVKNLGDRAYAATGFRYLYLSDEEL